MFSKNLRFNKIVDNKNKIYSDNDLSDREYKNIILELESIKDSPKLFPYSLDIQNNKIDFVKMDKADYKKSFFIMSPGNGPGHLKSKYAFSMNFDDVIDIFKDHNYLNKSSIIYNHGFCCGTLLSRLLEESFNVLSLREPPLLHTLKHHLETNKNDHHIKNTIFCLYNRSFSNNQKVLWKPSDYAFDLIDTTESLRIPSLYLYSPLREYIASCSKEKRAEWIKNRANYEKILNYLNIPANKIDITKTANQAMLYWTYFAKKFILYSSKSKNLIALNSKNLLNKPKIINAVGQHLGLKNKFNIFKNINTKKLLNTYSKTDDYEFNKDIRSDLLNKIIQKNINDITKAEEIAEEILNMSIGDFKFDKELL